ncbi:MAG: ATP-dependent DNA helicase RecG [Calditrichaeota bacterium]|nr:ATP-dependent DNA helicase RecG [Calditrichota bacterium]
MLKWTDPVEKISGIADKKSIFLREKGFETIGDLLIRAPLRFIDRRDSPPFSKLHEAVGAEITAIGTIESVGEKGRYRKRRLLCMISDGSGGYVTGVWFSKYKYIKPKLIPGLRVALAGKVSFFDGPQISHPRITILDASDEMSTKTGLIPVYPEGEEWKKHGFSKTIWEGFVKNLIGAWDGSGPFPPPELIKFEGLVSLPEAIRGLHLPESVDEYDKAVSTLKFNELFQHQLLMVALRRRRRQKGGIVFATGEKYKKFIEILPFELSKGQKDVLEEMSGDFISGRPMHRLMQGEVGSGKTVVAFGAAVMAADGNRQTVIMAPTELLARQHYENALKWLEPIGVKPILIAASRHPDEIKRALFEATTGQADLIIGTHAVFQDRVKPPHLGLVIIDEQQRFGVRQRARLINKAIRPHVLLMTATPIPRTLALAYYGDLDLIELKMREGVERNVTTRVVTDSSRDKVFRWYREKLGEGERGYLVFPVIDSGVAGLEAAHARFEPYQKVDFKGISIALMHGRQPIEDRIRAMEAFRSGDVKLLMATSVIEVGVDVPEANLMVIENSERFGLAQIHQLRGRIGRTGAKAYCILMTREPEDSPSFERLRKLQQCDDGFTLAEEDLQLRGSGEPLGARQSGSARFQIANLGTDMKLLRRAHKSAEWLLDKHPDLAPYSELRERLRSNYRKGPRTMLAG